MKSFFLIVIAVFGLSSCTREAQEPAARVKNLYTDKLSGLQMSLEGLSAAIKAGKPAEALQKEFRLCRERYKQVEFLAEYFSPVTAANINGPNLEKVDEEDPTRTVKPCGFQVLEEIIFPEFSAELKDEALGLVRGLISDTKRLQLLIASQTVTDRHVFEAMRLEVARAVTLGISGFDSPVALNSIAELEAVITSMQEYFRIYGELLDEASRRDMDKIFSGARAFITTNNNFDKFDRAAFIIDFGNPLSERLLAAQKKLNVEFSTSIQPLSAHAPHIFARNAFDARAFAPSYARGITAEGIALGRQLFFDPVLSGNGKRSCASCHNPARAFTDGLEKAIAIDGKTKVRRNVPTIINAGFQRASFYDSRVRYLEDQARVVIENPDEMHGSLEKAVQKISAISSYREKFARAFGGSEPVTAQNICIALAGFQRSLTSFESHFDRYMRGERSMLTAEEKSGFNLFMGRAKCGTCHFAPLFNGTVPPAYMDTESEVLGVPAHADLDRPGIDGDEGKFVLYNLPIHQRAFKTPTLRNIELTAPYMHNGVFRTLEEVMEFYDRGGGAGLGLDVPNQTLPADRLLLSSQEKKALIAFMKSLTNEIY